MKLDLNRKQEQIVCRAQTGGYGMYRIPGILCHAGVIFLTCEARMEGSDWGDIDVVISRVMPDGTVRELLKIGESHLPRIPAMRTYNNPTLIPDGERLHVIYHYNYDRVFIVTTDDMGETWTLPREITDDYRRPDYDWNVSATGPGHGLCTQSGRLVAPIWLAQGEEFENGVREHRPSRAGCVYSDDHGLTWKVGHLTEGIINPNETSVGELPDGTLVFNYRNENWRRDPADKHRMLGFSDDGGETITAYAKPEALIDPVCFGGMVSFGDALLFANCDSQEKRVNLTVKASVDRGESWETIWKVDPMSGYPDIACDGERVYLFYERNDYEKGGIRELVLASAPIVKE
ncbi:MAG: exo-alpha-sialidase [Ruminococcaceae bacterium]|nr:exo-alpha-sialidase [Oscillospiraceae bacterium]